MQGVVERHGGLRLVAHQPQVDRENFQDRWLQVAKRHRTPLADLLCRQMVRASPMFAAYMLLQGPRRAPFFGRFLVGNVHLKWDKILTQQKRFALMAPRGIGKSKVFSFAYPLWQVIRNVLPDGLLVSSTGDNAKEVLAQIREEVESNPLLEWLIPARRQRRWNQSEMTFSNGHTLHSRSCLSRLRGRHPGYIMGDDILADDAKISEAYRRKTANFWFNVLEMMPTPDGQMGLCGTPMHQSDLLYHELKENPEYQHFSFPILDRAGVSLWPEGFPVEHVARIRRTIGPTRFTTEMLLEPVSDDTSMLPRKLMRGAQEAFHVALGAGAEALAALGLSFFMGVDLAFSDAHDADFFAIVVLGVDKNQNRWVVDGMRARGLSYQSQMSYIQQLGRKYPNKLIYVEANQAQVILPNELARTTSLPVRPFVTTARKNDLTDGLPGLRLLAENEKWRFPMADARSMEFTERLQHELESFTFLGGKVRSVGDHDDLAMALYLANEAAKEGDTGFKFDRRAATPTRIAPMMGPETRPAGRFGPSSTNPLRPFR